LEVLHGHFGDAAGSDLFVGSGDIHALAVDDRPPLPISVTVQVAGRTARFAELVVEAR